MTYLDPGEEEEHGGNNRMYHIPDRLREGAGQGGVLGAAERGE